MCPAYPRVNPAGLIFLLHNLTIHSQSLRFQLCEVILTGCSHITPISSTARISSYTPSLQSPSDNPIYNHYGNVTGVHNRTTWPPVAAVPAFPGLYIGLGLGPASSMAGPAFIYIKSARIHLSVSNFASISPCVFRHTRPGMGGFIFFYAQKG